MSATSTCRACVVDPNSAVCLHDRICLLARRWMQITRIDAEWMAANGTDRRTRALLPLEIQNLRGLEWRVDERSAHRWVVEVLTLVNGTHRRIYRRAGRQMWSIEVSVNDDGPRAGDAGAARSSADDGDAANNYTALRLVSGADDQAIDAAVRRHPAGKRRRNGGAR